MAGEQVATPDVDFPDLDADVTQRWSVSYLREQFRPFEALYLEYVRRLQCGYFSIYMILQFLLSTSYLLLICIENANEKLEVITPDVYVYGVAALLSPIALFVVSERSVVGYSLVTYALLFAVEALLPVYHRVAHARNARAPFATHLVIASYIFLACDAFAVAVVGGALVTGAHLVLFAFADAPPPPQFDNELIAECVFFACVNAVGAYFHYVNEITHRRGFLAKKDQTLLKIERVDKQRRQQRLLEAILPPELAQNIIADKHKYSFLLHNERALAPNALFYKKHLITEHKNVTVLYADIVNYTQMTTEIKSASTLVHLLNELFGAFDVESEKLGVMRIKFLGDCYYCVSGLEPKRNQQHADACVRLGLRIIAQMHAIGARHALADLDARVGVHTGDILAALVGRTKCQYEIWSRDVQLANAMESAGFPGRIHATQATIDELEALRLLEAPAGDGGVRRNAIDADECYYVYPTNAVDHVAELATRTPMTYIITADPMTDMSIFDVRTVQRNHQQQHQPPKQSKQRLAEKRFVQRISAPGARPRTSSSSRSLRKDSNRRSGNASDASMADFHTYENDTQRTISEEIKRMPLSKYAQWFEEDEIHPLLLVFRDRQLECNYVQLDDELFKYNIVGATVVFVCATATRYIDVTHWISLVATLPIAFGLLLLIPLVWLPQRWCHAISDCFVRTWWLRTLIYLLLCIVSSVSLLLQLADCNYNLAALEGDCLPPWNITQLVSLTLVMSFVFLRMHVWLKLTFSVVVTSAYACWIWQHAYGYYVFFGERFEHLVQPPVAHIVFTVCLATMLHFVDRQADYLHRLDDKWNRQLRTDRKRNAALHRDTLALLRNVMPYDVAVKYLHAAGADDGKLYHERYPTAAVMFATVVTPSGDDDAVSVLALMNEIISAFDEVLLDHYAGRVEKIKLANLSTYVACAGLAPGRRWMRDAAGPLEDAEHGVRARLPQRHDIHLLTLLEFAVDIRKALMRHNLDSNLNSSLRIGLADGKLTAGVVGTRKPHYDVWGDCVNVASRMDTNGTAGCIQVADSTQMVLARNGIACEFNRHQFIKGKDWLDTYFVQLDEDGDVVHVTTSTT